MKRIALILGAALLMVTGTMTAFADRAPKETPPEPYEVTQGDYTLKLTAGGDVPSGLYQGQEMLYPMPDMNNISQVFISPDGQQIAIIYGECSVLISNDMALAFYNKGNLTQSYMVRKLVVPFMTDRDLESTVWEKTDERNYDPLTNQLTIASMDHSVRVFNMKDGSIISEKNPLKIALLALLFLVLVVVFLLYWFSKYNGLRNKSKELQKQDAQTECMKKKLKASEETQKE